MQHHIKPAAILFIAFLFSVNSFPQINYKNRIEIVFTHKMKQEDLMKIKEDIQKKNIQLDFVQTRFNDSGYLISLAFKVDCKDGFHGEASNPDLNKFTRHFGFFRDYNKKAKTPFGVGFI